MEEIKYFINIGSIIGFFVILFFLFTIIQRTINRIRGIKNEKLNIKFDKKINTLIFISVTCFIINEISSSPLGSTQIGSLIEKPEYTEKYYVYLYPEGSQSKNYKLEADISAKIIKYEEGSEREYFIDKAYFPNGGYIAFDYEDNYSDPLQIGKRTTFRDNKSKYWDIELTKEKVKK